MNKSEFLSWLDGYICGGGKDIGVISEKLNQVYPDLTYPTFPTPIVPDGPYEPYPEWAPYTLSTTRKED